MEKLHDTDLADRFLDLLGFASTDPVILSAGALPGSGHEGYWRIPRRGYGAYNWDRVKYLASQGRNWEGFIKLLEDRPNACFQSCIGGTRKDEITGGWLLVYEIDRFPKEQQYGLWEKAGLPDPTVVLDSGHGSLHVWFRVDQHYEPDDIEHGRKRLAAAVEKVLPEGVKCDPSVALVHQPMRLPGFIHPKSGEMATIAMETGNVYSLNEILDCCPPLTSQGDTTTQGRGDETNLWNEIQEGDALPARGSYPSPSDFKGVAVPLMLAVTFKTEQKIKDGQRPGCSPHRFETAHRISRTLQAAKVAIESEGYSVAGNPYDYFEDFCCNSRCERGYLGKFSDLHQCAAHFETRDFAFGPAEVSLPKFRRDLARWAINAGHWKPGFKPSSPHVRDGSLKRRLEFFRRYVTRCVREQRNSLRRNVYLRDVLDKLKLKSRFKDKDLNELVLAAQSQKSGEVFKPLTAEDRRKMAIPKVEWLVPDCIPAGDLTIICGRAKVGKTILVMDLVRCLLRGEQFLGFEAGGKHKVLLITDDQGDGDTALMLQRQGIWDHDNLIWTSKFRVTEEQLDHMLQVIKQNPGLVVVIDSLRSTTRALDCTESDSSLGLVLYDLKQAVVDAGGSMVLIHHANKTPDAIGMEAMSGHNSIAGAANGVLSLSYLTKKDGKALQKNIPDRRLVREARSGPPCDLVVTIGEQGRFRSVGSFEEIEERAAQQAAAEAHRKSLRSCPIPVRDALLNMLDRFDQGQGPTAVIPLLRETGHCEGTVRVKGDLENDSKYKTLGNRLKGLRDDGLVEEVLQAGGFSGRKNQRGWQLTAEGAELVRDCLSA